MEEVSKHQSNTPSQNFNVYIDSDWASSGSDTIAIEFCTSLSGKNVILSGNEIFRLFAVLGFQRPKKYGRLHSARMLA